MAVSTARACLRRLSPFVYSHNNSQAAARSGMSGFCSTGEARGQVAFLCGPLRISVFSALKDSVNAEAAEGRRENYSARSGGEVAGPRANHDILPRSRDL